MPSEKELTEIEIRRVWFVSETGMAVRRSKTAAENIIKHAIDSLVQKKSGAKSKLFQRD